MIDEETVNEGFESLLNAFCDLYLEDPQRPDQTFPNRNVVNIEYTVDGKIVFSLDPSMLDDESRKDKSALFRLKTLMNAAPPKFRAAGIIDILVFNSPSGDSSDAKVTIVMKDDEAVAALKNILAEATAEKARQIMIAAYGAAREMLGSIHAANVVNVVMDDILNDMGFARRPVKGRGPRKRVLEPKRT